MCFDLDSRPPITPIAGGALDSRRLVLTADDGNRLTAFEARASAPDGAAILILPDVRGLHPYYEELALRFAEHGIDALAIDYFGRTAGTEPRPDTFEYRAARRPDPVAGTRGRHPGRHRRPSVRRRRLGADTVQRRLLLRRPSGVPDRGARPRVRRGDRLLRLACRRALHRVARARGCGGPDQRQRARVVRRRRPGDPGGHGERVRDGADGGRRRPPVGHLPRAHRTASSTARPRTTPMRAPRPGTRCSGSSGSERPPLPDQVRATIRPPALRGATTAVRPGRSPSAAVAVNAASIPRDRRGGVAEGKDGRTGPDRQAPSAPAERAASTIAGSCG